MPGQGRQFTAVGTFALLPPTYFRAWGVIANPLSNNPATRGYSRTYSRTADYRPLGVFLAEFSAQASSIASLASVLTPFPGSALSDVTTPALTVGASIPNAFIYSAVSQNQGHTDTLFTSSFLPDVPGTYSLVATLTDDCPSSTPVTLSGGSGLTVTVVGLSQCGDPTTPFGNGVSMSQSPATVNGDFVNRQLGFGTPWNYTVTSTQVCGV